MDFQTFAWVAQDGLTTGTIYALISLALVMIFAVTRIIFVPQGEFLSFGTLTLACIQEGKFPGTVWLLLVFAVLASTAEIIDAHHRSRSLRGTLSQLRSLAFYLGLPLLIAAVTWAVTGHSLPFVLQVMLALMIVTAMGPLLYRFAFQPVAGASVLLLLIISVAIHVALTGLGLLFFGAEGARTSAFTDGSIELGSIDVPLQNIWVIGTCLAAILVLYLFFERTIYGRALRATACNRTGARLVGISPSLAGALTFTLAAALGALSGVLIGPITTIYYDSGFLSGLKGFVGAIIGGMASYPLAAAGAILVGLLEGFGSFWASAYKEVIVFTLIIPVLLWRSYKDPHREED
ncbi:branched-chain amino acid ABC transporter permease [Telmatospirillum sp.]|uniref:branched-chain amino acid ABC transporter permease n=1 Tax=Telmatospirillum sp. TaxID=2079197 RepID=UPI00284F6B97|nr:branched-chain amino acid ABC transporter permease [Telmatospirillum sp.]MDR3437841.1 branched-chain amino acid ABC transporter permease [Telmatospirillum sp.]